MPTGGNDGDTGGSSVGVLCVCFACISLTGIAFHYHNVTRQ